MACSTNFWSEAIHNEVIDIIREFTKSFGNHGRFSVKFEIQKNDPTCTFMQLKFKHITNQKTLSKMKFILNISNRKEIEILKSILNTIHEHYDKHFTAPMSSNSDD